MHIPVVTLLFALTLTLCGGQDVNRFSSLVSGPSGNPRFRFPPGQNSGIFPLAARTTASLPAVRSRRPQGIQEAQSHINRAIPSSARPPRPSFSGASLSTSTPTRPSFSGAAPSPLRPTASSALPPRASFPGASLVSSQPSPPRISPLNTFSTVTASPLPHRLSPTAAAITAAPQPTQKARRTRPRLLPVRPAPVRLQDEDYDEDDFALPSSGRNKNKKVVQTLERYSLVNEDGSITWGYVQEDGTYKEETIGADCITRGKYGYIDPDGEKREYTYVTGLPCDDEEELEDEEDTLEDTGFFDYDSNVYVTNDGREIPLRNRPNRRRQ